MSGDESTEVLVQFRDGAGNESAVACGQASGVACSTAAGYRMYLPISARGSAGGW